METLRDNSKWNAMFALVADIDRDIAQAKADTQEKKSKMPPQKPTTTEWSSIFTGDMRQNDMEDAEPGEPELELQQAPTISAVLAGASPQQAQELQQEQREICKRAAEDIAAREAKRYRLRAKQQHG